MSISKTQLQKN